MLPPRSALTETATTMWGHSVKHGSLVNAAKQDGTNTVLSPVFTAPSSILTERLLGKMNVMIGLDLPFYIGHHSGAHLGNYAAHRNGPDITILPPTATIDQVLGWSPKFYPDLAGIKQRVAVTGDEDVGMSHTWSNPMTRSGDINIVKPTQDTRALFDQLFAGAKAPTPGEPPPPKRPSIVDRILDSYKTLRNSNRRLSTEDRRRLDDHVAGLDELQRRLTDTGGGGKLQQCDLTKPSSGYPGGPEMLADAIRYESLLNDVIAMALACGVTRIAVNLAYSSFSPNHGYEAWHNDVIHIDTPANQQLIVAAKAEAFRACPLDLVAKLDTFEESPGVSLLDSCLVQWTQEAGNWTHETKDQTVVTFGSARGYFNTGRFIDFRSKLPAGDATGTGVMYRQWLATVLQSMGLTPADFEKGNPGYGFHYVDEDAKRRYASSVFSLSSQPMPLVTKL